MSLVPLVYGKQNTFSASKGIQGIKHSCLKAA